MENICGKEYCSAKSVEDEKEQKYLELINTQCSAVKIDIVVEKNSLEIYWRRLNTREERNA